MMAVPGTDAEITELGKQLAEHIASNPSLRTKFFVNVQDALDEVVPMNRLRPDPRKKLLREKVLEYLPAQIQSNAEAASSNHAQAVFQQFFTDAIRNPEISFKAILGLSFLAFGVGAALIVVSVVLTFDTKNGETEKAVLSGILGGGGVISLLSSLFVTARRGVSLANANNAQLRLILTSFASELGHLRAFDLKTAKQIDATNEKIRLATISAVELIQRNVKAELALPSNGSEQRQAEAANGAAGSSKMGEPAPVG